MSTTPDSSADPAARRRDPDRAREAILEAALIEFGSHGFAGARTAAIAKRAGLSTQLITHHFGGKQGVLDELRRRWKTTKRTGSESPQTFRDSVTAHMEGVAADTNWSRLVLWHALEGAPDAAGRDDFASRMGHISASIAERQRNGELNSDADPRFIALLGYMIAFAPLSLPDHIQGLIGHDGVSPEYREWAAEQLAALVAAAPPADDGQIRS
jgi:TetR/AcrR family transcriptional regulator